MEKKVVLCYGDSNTYGYDPRDGGRYPLEKRWVTMLADKLGDEYLVVPEGLNGRTTAYEREGEPWKNGLCCIKPCVATHRPLDCLIFMLGTNDCGCTSLNLSLEDIEWGMEQLIISASQVLSEKQGWLPKCVIVAPAAIRANTPQSAYDISIDQEAINKSRALAPIYKALAEKYGGIFVDATDAAEVSPIDGVHLTEKGHRQIAELIYESVFK